MKFDTRLRRVCSRCTESSIKTYTANIKALAKLAGLQAVPDSDGNWVNDSLLAKIKREPLGRFKRFAIAGRKAIQAYAKQDASWAQAVVEATVQYDTFRNQQKKTKREIENWPKDGYDSLRRLAAELYEEEVLPILEEGSPEHATSGDLYKIQRHFVVLFYAWHALRGDLAEARIEPKGQNYIYLGAGNPQKWRLHIGVHKTVRAHGAIDFELAQPVADALDVFLPYVRAMTTHGFLLTTLRTHGPMHRRDMLKMLRKITKERLGKTLGVQMIRVLRVSAAAEQINETTELRRQMAHGAATQFQYVSK